MFFKALEFLSHVLLFISDHENYSFVVLNYYNDVFDMCLF